MTAFKILRLVLILIAAAGPAAWSWPGTSAPLQGQADQPAQLGLAGAEAGSPVFLAARGTAIELTWLGRRAVCVNVPACASDLLTAEAILSGSGEPATSAGPRPIGSSLVSLGTQLTI